MSADLYFEWWTDEQGEPRVRHHCLDGEVDEYRVPSPWRVVSFSDGEGLEPSFNCAKCGRHVILGPADRIPAPREEGKQWHI